VFGDEERRFDKLLTRGRKVLAQYQPGTRLSQQDLTYLHETHGLPPDLVVDLLA
jgi:alanyl-tRNA synthetase